jgi:diacylglycerol kinase (ATP)
VTVGVIWNPAAGAGRMRRQWPRIRAALESRFADIRFVATERPRHAGDLVSELVADGAEMIVAVGGDGTVSEIADGLLRLGTAYASMVGFGVVPLGTGSDFARGLGLSGGHEAIVDRLATGPARAIDAGRMDYDIDNAPPGRHFINMASVGVSAEIAQGVDRSRVKAGLRGRATFYLQTVRHLLGYRFPHLKVWIDGDVAFDAPAAAVIVANGRYFGGGMKIAPSAELDDGLFEIVIIRGRSRWELIRALGSVYGGRHVKHPACIMLRGRIVRVEAPGGEDVLVELDGEVAASLPVRFEVLDRPISLRGG